MDFRSPARGAGVEKSTNLRTFIYRRGPSDCTEAKGAYILVEDEKLDAAQIKVSHTLSNQFDCSTRPDRRAIIRQPLLSHTNKVGLEPFAVIRKANT
jgi:hypothetical protein